MDENGDPSPASFGGDGVEEARTLYGRVAHQRCIELGFRDSEGRADLEWRAEKQVDLRLHLRGSGCAGQRYYAIRIWGDRIRCEYVEYL